MSEQERGEAVSVEALMVLVRHIFCEYTASSNESGATTQEDRNRSNARDMQKQIESLASRLAASPEGATIPQGWSIQRHDKELLVSAPSGNGLHVSADSPTLQSRVLYELAIALLAGGEAEAPSLTELNELAKQYATSYASPHHFTLSVEGLRNLIAASATKSVLPDGGQIGRSSEHG